MRNPLHIGPEGRHARSCCRETLQFASGDGAGALAGMPPADTQSSAHRSRRHAKSPVGHLNAPRPFSCCTPAAYRRKCAIGQKGASWPATKAACKTRAATAALRVLHHLSWRARRRRSSGRQRVNVSAWRSHSRAWSSRSSGAVPTCRHPACLPRRAACHRRARLWSRRSPRGCDVSR
jgi:hypothetical protein